MGDPSKGKILVSTPPPTADQQIEFLGNIQRLLSEGSFVATYKYALLLALADLSIEKGQDDGSALTITTTQIAEKIISYYWRQALPFGSSYLASPVVLRQNTGRAAAMINAVERAISHQGSLERLKADHKRWRSLLTSIRRTVEVMPLWKLQRMGQQVVDFLYPNVGTGSTITLKPGVAYCLRKYYGLIGDLVRGAWVRYVRRFNPDVFGTFADLHEFLFGSERANLKQVAGVLVEIQKGECFYCGGRVGAAENNVDHFIPWSRYPVDLGHNFVLAHGTCNGAKSDTLASVPHLRSWVGRNTKHVDELAKGFESIGIVHHLPTSTKVARWAYNQVAATGGQTWTKGKDFEPLEEDWQEVFTAITN